MRCDSTDFMFPMKADIYYPTVEQSAYGQVSKTWMLDRTVAGSFTPLGANSKQRIVPNDAVVQEFMLSGRVRCDVRITSEDGQKAFTNIVLTNIRDAHGNEIYTETAGARSGKSTIFEIASQEPFVGPFGNIEYYRLVLKRSENQGDSI